MTSCRPGVPGGHYWLATGERRDCHELHRCQNCGDTCWLAITWEQQEEDQQAKRATKGKRTHKHLFRVGKAPGGLESLEWVPRGRRRSISLRVLGPGKG